MKIPINPTSPIANISIVSLKRVLNFFLKTLFFLFFGFTDLNSFLNKDGATLLLINLFLFVIFGNLKLSLLFLTTLFFLTFELTTLYFFLTGIISIKYIVLSIKY